MARTPPPNRRRSSPGDPPKEVTAVSDDLSALSSMVYPGRVIIIGRTPDGRHDVVVYAVTGRSSSSRARRLVHDGGGTVRTEVTDPELLRGGNEKLLIYHCLRPYPDGMVVSNGDQTDLIAETAESLMVERTPLPAVEVLRQAFHKPHLISGVDVTTYEPDPPAYTPRISGLLAGDAALGIVRRAPDGSAGRDIYPVPLTPGRGRSLATYTGTNTDPLPAFQGPPVEVGLTGESPQETAETVFEALGPETGDALTAAPNGGNPDLRVGVAVLFRDRDTGGLEVAIINRTEGGS